MKPYKRGLIVGAIVAYASILIIASINFWIGAAIFIPCATFLMYACDPDG